MLVIVTEDGTAAGTVSLWDHEWEGDPRRDGGMVLPKQKKRGLASAGGRRGAETGGRDGSLFIF